MQITAGHFIYFPQSQCPLNQITVVYLFFNNPTLKLQDAAKQKKTLIYNILGLQTVGEVYFSFGDLIFN